MGKKKDKKIVLNEDGKRRFLIIVVMVLITSIIIFAFALTWFLLNKEMDEKRVRKEGNVEIAFTVDDKALTIEDAFPMNELGGQSRESQNFKLINNGEEYINYAVVLSLDEEKHEACLLANDNTCPVVSLDKLRYRVIKNGIDYDSKLLKDNQYVIDLGVIQPGEENEIYIELQIWVDIDAEDVPYEAKFFGKLDIVTQTQ